jgi:hypothetical protein
VQACFSHEATLVGQTSPRPSSQTTTSFDPSGVNAALPLTVFDLVDASPDARERRRRIALVRELRRPAD